MIKNISIAKTLIFFSFLSVISCSRTTLPQPTTDDGKFTLTIVQVNDVYEIAPINNGKEGGVARIAALKKQELNKNDHTFLVIAGDFLSPSVFNSLKVNGERIRGAQMVDALNAAGLDFAGFGNHEFDIKQTELQQRLNESKFTWIASNVYQKQTLTFEPFFKETATGKEYIPESVILELTDDDGTSVKVGIFSVLLPFNQVDYVAYRGVFESAQYHYNQLAKTCDAVIAITHLSMEDDELLAKTIPGLAMIIGGHEHDMRYAQIGNVAITKAHANARSAYVNELVIDKHSHSFHATETLVPLDEHIPLDEATSQVVDKWMSIASQSYVTSGFDPNRVIQSSGEAYDLLETSIRSRPTNFSKMVVKAMEKAVPNAQLAIVNSGSMRLDDMLSPPITEYDILRAMPFGGKIKEVTLTGKLLKQILTASALNKHEGGYLQVSESIDTSGNSFLFNGKEILDSDQFTVAIADFLLMGLEANLDFLTPENEGVLHVVSETENELTNDIRRAVIHYLSTE